MRYIFLCIFNSFLLLGVGTGTPPVPSTITSSPKLTLYKGWNLIASPTNNPFNTSLIKGVVGSDIYLYDSKLQSWESGVNTEVPPGVGFWVNVDTQSLVDYRSSASVFPISNFKVNKGWNLLGMSRDSIRVKNIAPVLDAQAPFYKVKIIFTYDAKTSTWNELPSYYGGSIYAGMGFWLETE